MRGHPAGLAAGVAALVALAGAPVAGAEIVYKHGSGVGSTLMAMNDDGSGAHVLLSAANVPPNDQLAYPSLLPNGTTLVFQGITDENDNLNGPPGDGGANYGGLYTLSGGAVTRLSAPPAPVANAGSEDTSPSITADGRVVYEALATTYYSDGSGPSGYSDQLLVRPLAGGAPSAWQTSPQTSFGRDAADPANGGLIAYTTNPPSQLAIGNQSGTGTAIVADQPQGYNPAWSPDGSQLADLDWTDASSTGSGYSAGIWVFPAHAGGVGREILADPNPPASEFHAGTFNYPTFAGPNEIIFQATVGSATNLYEVSTSCNACAFPGPGVKQLTTDGTATSPDTYPAWTSRTLTPPGQRNGSPSLSIVHPSTAKLRTLLSRGVSVKVSASEPVAAGLVLAINAATARRLKIGRRQTELAQASGRVARSKTFTLKPKRTYRRKLAAVRSFTVYVIVLVEDAAGNKAEKLYKVKVLR